MAEILNLCRARHARERKAEETRAAENRPVFDRPDKAHILQEKREALEVEHRLHPNDPETGATHQRARACPSAR